MDQRWKYNNVKIKEGDKWKMAFTTPEGSFESTIMLIGLTNSPATFQMMNKLLIDLINMGKVRSFIDDIIVGTEIEEGHDELVAEVLRRLEENYLYVKLEKCEWMMREINFLGVVLGLKGIKMKEAKVKAVFDWPVPKSVKDIQMFLRLTNYYRRFIEGFVKIVRLLHKLTRKEQKWKWEIRQEKSFKALKKQFTTEPIFVAPDLDKKMRIEVDASDYTTGKVLSMEYNDGKQRPVAYLSKLLNEIKINYEIHNKKMLVVIRGLENWRYLLKGTRFKFEIWMDHKNLEYFMKAQKLNRRQTRWVLYLLRFNFTLKYVLGIRMEKADGLNRRPDQKISIENDNINQVFIKDHCICNLYEVVIEEPKVDIVENNSRGDE